MLINAFERCGGTALPTYTTTASYKSFKVPCKPDFAVSTTTISDFFVQEILTFIVQDWISKHDH